MDSIMNRYIFFLLFFIMISPSIFLAMDNLNKIIALELLADSFEERIIDTNDAINKICKNKDPITLLQRPLTGKKALSIIRLVYDLQKNAIDPLFIEALIKKNIFFINALNYYYELALKNRQQVKCDTIEIVSNYLNKQQPVDKLNELPLPFKKYVMKKAYVQITRLYNIIFEGHTDSIVSIDANIPFNLAASASKDETFCLWRLSNGKLLHTFDETAHHGYVKFNDDGSQLATATVYKENPHKIRICIWDTISRQCLYKMKHTDPITHLNFFPNGKTSITMVISKNNFQSLYKLKKDNPPLFLGSITRGIKTKKERISYAKEVNNYCWLITKNSHRLGLCEEAIYNTKNKKSLLEITQTSTYGKLTDYEKDILQIKLKQRIETIEQRKPIQMLHTLLG